MRKPFLRIEFGDEVISADPSNLSDAKLLFAHWGLDDSEFKSRLDGQFVIACSFAHVEMLRELMEFEPSLDIRRNLDGKLASGPVHVTRIDQLIYYQGKGADTHGRAHIVAVDFVHAGPMLTEGRQIATSELRG